MKFINNVDLNKNELRNAVVHKLSSAPSNPVEGQEYYNTAEHKKYIYSNGAWVDETSQGNYTFSGGLSESNRTVTANLSDANPSMDGTASAGTSTNISRADHIHPTDTSRAAASDLTSHTGNTSNPHSVTKTQVGLGNVTDDAQVKRSEMGVASGVATLGTDGKVLSSQLPSFVDDVLEYASQSAFPATGESGKIYVALDTNKTYRWGGSAYVEISASLALGETSSTAYRGDRGKTAYDHSQLTSGNPHNVKFSDLSDKPDINDAALTIQKNGVTVATFTANDSDNVTANITTPVVKTATNPALTTSSGLCTWEITNEISSADVIVQLREVSSNEVVLADIVVTASTITVKIVSSSNISAGAYKAIIIG